MKEMDYSEFKKLTNENPEGLMFEIKCKKCNAKNVLLEGFNEIQTGSEYTGTWGDAGFIIKCKTCGNAYKINVEEN